MQVGWSMRAARYTGTIAMDQWRLAGRAGTVPVQVHFDLSDGAVSALLAIGAGGGRKCAAAFQRRSEAPLPLIGNTHSVHAGKPSQVCLCVSLCLSCHHSSQKELDTLNVACGSASLGGLRSAARCF